MHHKIELATNFVTFSTSKIGWKVKWVIKSLEYPQSSFCRTGRDWKLITDTRLTRITRFWKVEIRSLRHQAVEVLTRLFKITASDETLIKKKHSMQRWEKGQRRRMVKERNEKMYLAATCEVCRSLVFTAPCFVDLSSYFYLFLSLTHVERARASERKCAQSEVPMMHHLVQLGSSMSLLSLVTEFKCVLVAQPVITFSLFHPCIWSVSFAFFLGGESHLSIEKTQKRHSQISPSFHPRLTPHWPQHAKLFYCARL